MSHLLSAKSIDCLKASIERHELGHGGFDPESPYGRLCDKYGEKAVTKTFESLVGRGYMECGTSARTGWITQKGRDALADYEKACANGPERPRWTGRAYELPAKFTDDERDACQYLQDCNITFMVDMVNKSVSSYDDKDGWMVYPGFIVLATKNGFRRPFDTTKSMEELDRLRGKATGEVTPEVTGEGKSSRDLLLERIAQLEKMLAEWKQLAAKLSSLNRRDHLGELDLMFAGLITEIIDRHQRAAIKAVFGG